MNKTTRLLMLEDNLFDADLIRRQLRKSDLALEVLHVNNGADFEVQLTEFCPDLVLSDYSLPSIDGTTAFHMKQKLCPDVPFIVVSGTIGEENAVDLIKNGITDYVIKDKLFTLVPKIKRALKDAEDERMRRIKDAKFREHYNTLLDIASMQSHQVRAPISNVLGLINLFDMENPAAPINREIIQKLKKTTESFDAIIVEIVRKTAQIDKLES